MLFNSLEFLIFFAVFIAAWPMLRKGRNTRWIYLVVASFFFYGWWDWRFLFLIIASGLIDYFAGLGMGKYPSRRKLFLILSIFGNIGSLAVFKYMGFFIDNINWVCHAAGADFAITPMKIILPVGISFYTFQSMSYTIDVYKGQLKPTHNIFHFFAYLSMFPQLVAGPIVRAADLLPQLEEVHHTTEQQRFDAMKLIVYGFCKKVVVADNLAPIVDQAFSSHTLTAGSLYWWLIMVMFAYQIYCDFSGYSDIARGLGRWMGYEFPVNFDHPYIANNFRDFWGRWHISLSTWFRDYVYIPLGGSRGSTLRMFRNLWIVFLISGLWHGSSWNFVIWGAAHAMFQTVERIWDWPGKLSRVPVVGRHLTVLIVFILATLAWVFFRAETFSQSTGILYNMFNFAQLGTEHVRQLMHDYNLAFNVLLIMIARQLFFHFRLDGAGWLYARGALLRRILQPVVLAALVAGCIYFRGTGQAFIYFQF